MADLRELYQEQIRDHSKKPRNFRKVGESTCHADGRNPLCGDHVTIYVALDGDQVKDVAFEGAGCAICTASASMMTEALKGKTRADAEALFEKFHHLLTDGEIPSEGPGLGKLEVFAGVREYPVRIKCATLPWHTFNAALKDLSEPVSTE
jgi:nitrogen fixation NifU-like protein